MAQDIRREARHCLELGLALCPIPPGQKGPLDKGWPERPILTPGDVDRRLAPSDNYGIIHGSSGTAAVDVDDLDAGRAALSAHDVDLDHLLATGLQIASGRPGRAKLLYLTPAGLELTRKVLKGPEGRVAVELRGGPGLQDVAPGSIHPSGSTYRWAPDPPRSRSAIPELPEPVLTLWRELMAPPPPTPARPAPLNPTPGSGASVIAAFNRAYDLTAILEAHGYRRKGKRWLAPQSTSGLAGVVLLERGAYSHHGSDPLATGRCVDAFDCFRLLDHGGDLRAAVRAAADLVGAPRRSPDEPTASWEAPLSPGPTAASWRARAPRGGW